MIPNVKMYNMFINVIIIATYYIILYYIQLGHMIYAPKKKVWDMLTALVLEWDHKCLLFSSVGLPVFSVHAMINNMHKYDKYA